MQEQQVTLHKPCSTDISLKNTINYSLIKKNEKQYNKYNPYKKFTGII